MAGPDEDASDKPHEATPRKLDEARKRGELPRLADLTATAALAGLLLLALLPGGWMPERVAIIGRGLFDRADALGVQMLGGGTDLAGRLLAEIALALAPVALLPAAMVLATLMALRGLVFAPEKLKPKLSRISPLSNARQKFGPSGLFEFGKNTVKLAIYGTILWLFLADRLPRLMGAIAQAPGQVTAELLRLTVEFLLLVAVIMAAIGALDHVFQRYDHQRRQRMSHRELKEEMKQSEGDPHLKQARRARAQSIAANRMLADVANASVVVVNPEHYAVALRWTPGDAGAPVCLAKGVDEIALRIRERAALAGVPIHADPPTARALHASVEIGQQVRPEHYAPVAAAIRFAEAMRLKARGRGAGTAGARAAASPGSGPQARAPAGGTGAMPGTPRPAGAGGATGPSGGGPLARGTGGTPGPGQPPAGAGRR